MADEEVQLMSMMDEMVIVYVTYDTDDATVDEDLEAYRIVWDVPVGVTVTANIWRVCLVMPPQSARRAAPQLRCRVQHSNRNAMLGPAICIRLTERGYLDIEPAP